MVEEPAPCDKCGLPVFPSQGRYTLADEFDENDNWIAARHMQCHSKVKKDFDEAGKRLDALLNRAKVLLEELRSKLQ